MVANGSNCGTQHFLLDKSDQVLVVGVGCSKNCFLSPYAVFMNAAIPIAAVLAVRRLYSSFDPPLNMYSAALSKKYEICNTHFDFLSRRRL